jgi:5-formyltetrahydrofolate cyclo-ligase
VTNLAQAKARLRHELRRRRREVDQAQAQQAGREVAMHLEAWEGWRAARWILGYVPVDGEVDVLPLLRKVLAQGRKVALPSPVPDPRQLCPRRWDGGELSPGPFGIPVPQGEPSPWPDVVLVPGVAFDLRGGRLGSGMGFYDRYLGRWRRQGPAGGVALGVAYDWQVVQEVPQEPHDARLDGVVTPLGLRWAATP